MSAQASLSTPASGILNDFIDTIDKVLSSRRSVTSNPDIHRNLILFQPVLRNKMYARLLSDGLPEDALQLYMSEFNSSSVKHFYFKTLQAAMKARQHPAGSTISGTSITTKAARSRIICALRFS
jgi:hypothetical protein